MRLIDGDALINRWNEMTSRGRTEFDQELLLVPTVNPVRRGRWVDPASSECYRCSVCEEYVQQPMPNLLYHYCPFCGARMEEQE